MNEIHESGKTVVVERIELLAVLDIRNRKLPLSRECVGETREEADG
jgi:hypothetical protein